MVQSVEVLFVGRTHRPLQPLEVGSAAVSAKLGELPCRFNVYTWAKYLTDRVFRVIGFRSRPEGFESASVVVPSFVLHSPSASPIEIRRRFSFLLPPLFAPGRCAASLFRAVVMPPPGFTTAFVLAPRPEQRCV